MKTTDITSGDWSSFSIFNSLGCCGSFSITFSGPDIVFDLRLFETGGIERKHSHCVILNSNHLRRWNPCPRMTNRISNEHR